MTKPDLMGLLRDECAAHGQTAVAKMLGYSPAAISQVLNDKYKGDTGAILTRVEEVFGGAFVKCHELGEIPLSACAEHKRREPQTDSFYARMYRACRNCPQNNKGGK
ncbi:MAG: transcriptional regulator [Deltaproteobacteria bacterium]|nr:transcriptional regulator [Deltaproteobacteria bacterium]